jgi:hypothetical protein
VEKGSRVYLPILAIYGGGVWDRGLTLRWEVSKVELHQPARPTVWGGNDDMAANGSVELARSLHVLSGICQWAMFSRPNKW